MLHWSAWERGVKSLYYCRSLSIQRAETVAGEALAAAPLGDHALSTPSSNGPDAPSPSVGPMPPEMRDARTSGRRSIFESDEGMEQLLRDAGFVDVRTELSSVSVRFDDEDHWYRWAWSIARLNRSLPTGSRISVRPFSSSCQRVSASTPTREKVKWTGRSAPAGRTDRDTDAPA